MSTSTPRYIPHSHVPPTDLKAARHRIHEALVENVLRVHRHPSSNPRVYLGSAGEIIMDMRAFSAMSNKSFPNTPTSTLIAVPFHEPQHGNRVAYLETSVGPATLLLGRQLRLRQNPDSMAHKHARRGKLDAEILEEVELAETWRGAVDLMNAACEIATSEPIDDDGCEVLYGRAGLLYALLLLRSELQITLSYLEHAGKAKDKVVREVETLCLNESVKGVVDDIIQRGEFGAKEYAEELEESERPKAPALMWRWHGSRYLGAAHGVAGILHILVHAPSDIIQPHWLKVLSTIQWLLAIQDPLGNWPTKAGRHMPHIPGGAVQPESKRMGVDEEYDDSLVQWCHGASGFVMLFSALLHRSAASPTSCPLSPDLHDTIIASMTRAAELVYTRGFLTKGTGLCHGVAGSVYALLSISDALDTVHAAASPPTRSMSLSRTLSHHHSLSNPTLKPDHAYWLLRAVHMADLATGYRSLTQEGKMLTPEHPYSLYEGIAGMCCAWADVYARLSGGKDGANGTGTGNTNGAALLWRGGMPGYDDLALLE